MADPVDIAHLLRRTEFVVRPARLAALTALTREQAVDDITDFAANGNPQLPDYFKSDQKTYDQYVEACKWWLLQMATRPKAFQEKMTLFWHGHFTSSWADIDGGWRMMPQQQLYRANALGNFLSLTQQMALEPAMLMYLSNADNVKGDPNQNFARELMELFTLGVGNYTEGDVDSAARAWTGYNCPYPARDYVYRDTKHDDSDKTFFGTTQKWTGPQIIDEILRNNPGKRLIAARFITRKLWEFLAYLGSAQNIDTIVNELADVFIANNLELQPLLRALLKRPEFYSPTAKQGLVRTPIEWFAALCYYTNLSARDIGISWQAERTGQRMYDPPNVSGWKPNAYWLTTSGLSGRAGIAKSTSFRLRNNQGFDNVQGMATADLAVDYVADYFGLTAAKGTPLSTVSRNAMKLNWKKSDWWVVTNLLTMAQLTPEFHMA